jgi:hypothetical protein
VKRTLVVIAAFFAFGGTSFATGRYLITSTSQIKPSVLNTIERRVTASIKIPAPAMTPPPAAPIGQPSGTVASGPCVGSGALLTGGGFRWTGPGRFELTESYPRGKEWIVEGIVYGGGNLKAEAVCIVRF